MENYQKEFTEILSKAIEDFDSSAEDDVSIVTVIADVDKGQLIFGGLKLRDDLEGEGEYNEDSLVFYTAKSTYLKDYYKTINKDYEGYEKDEHYNYDGLMSSAEKLFSIMGEAINEDNELKDKLDGLLLYGWCGVMDQMVEADNFWSY